MINNLADDPGTGERKVLVPSHRLAISGNLPPEPINVILEDPRDPDILYIGTDLSAYVSLNRGKEWISLSNHLPTCAVHDLVIQDHELGLVAGNHGRSIFVLDIESIGTRK